VVRSLDGKARTSDGCVLSYRVHTRKGRPRLALIHSLGLDATIWEQVTAELQTDFEILTYDLRGHGQSERRPGPYSARLFASDLATVLDDCGWAGTMVAGCSLGGSVAQAFAAAYTERTLALGLIDTTAWYGPDALDDWRRRAARASEIGFAAMLPFQLGRWFSDGFREAHHGVVKDISSVFLANDMACYQASCALLGSEDLRGSLQAIRAPVSVIVGEEDFATPLAMSQALHAGIPGSTLTVIPGGRHLTPVEYPKEIAWLLGKLSRQMSTSAGV
jgi:3-oxoadipate enol-lactonase